MTDLLPPQVRFDTSRHHQRIRASATSWGETSSATGTSVETPILRSLLAVTNQNDTVIATVAVSFTTRVRDGNRVSLMGSDASGSLRVALDAEMPMAGLRMRFSFEAVATATPLALVPLVRWFDALRPDRRIGLWGSDHRKWLVGPERIPVDSPRLDPIYVSTVVALARICERSGDSMAMPIEISADESRDIDVADKLVRGKTVQGVWETAEMNRDPFTYSLLRNAEHGVMIELIADHHLVLGEQQILVGQVEYRLPHASLAPNSSGSGSLRLVAGVDRRMTARLVAVPQRARDDGSTAWIPDEMVKGLEGLWVAQTGSMVLDSADSFDRAVEAVRARGKLATVWRVPGDGRRVDDVIFEGSHE